jgi:hypothetical protein
MALKIVWFSNAVVQQFTERKLRLPGVPGLIAQFPQSRRRYNRFLDRMRRSAPSVELVSTVCH